MYISHSQMEKLRVAQWSLKNGSPLDFNLPLLQKKNSQLLFSFSHYEPYSLTVEKTTALTTFTIQQLQKGKPTVGLKGQSKLSRASSPMYLQM